MKFALVFCVSLFNTLSVAQDLTGLSPCGRMCIQNMLNKAESLGCPSADISCLCQSVNFGFGIRDCTTQACPFDDLAAIQAVGSSMCSGGLAESPGTPFSNVTKTAPDGRESSIMAGSTQVSPAPYTTKPIVSTITSSSLTLESTIGSTTLYTTNTRNISHASSVSASVSGPSTIISSSATSEASGSSGTSSSRAGVATPTSSGGATGVMASAGPGAAGIIGMAALLIL